MAKRPVLSTISNILTSLPFINSNYDAVDVAFDNTLSRDGSTPNNMLAELDMDGQNINNAGTVRTDSIVVGGNVLTASSALIAADATDVAIADAGTYYAGSTVEQALQEVGVDITSLTATTGGLGTISTEDASNVADFAGVATTSIPNRAAIATEIDTKIAAEVAEGSWTPALGTISGTFVSYTGQTEAVGFYRKQGNLVTVWFSTTYSNLGLNGAGGGLGVRLSGLPFTFGNTNASQTAPSMPIVVSTDAAGLGTSWQISYGASGDDYSSIGEVGNSVSGSDLASSFTRVDGSFSYITDE